MGFTFKRKLLVKIALSLFFLSVLVPVSSFKAQTYFPNHTSTTKTNKSNSRKELEKLASQGQQGNQTNQTLINPNLNP